MGLHRYAVLIAVILVIGVLAIRAVFRPTAPPDEAAIPGAGTVARAATPLPTVPLYVPPIFPQPRASTPTFPFPPPMTQPTPVLAPRTVEVRWESLAALPLNAPEPETAAYGMSDDVGTFRVFLQ